MNIDPAKVELDAAHEGDPRRALFGRPARLEELPDVT